MGTARDSIGVLHVDDEPDFAEMTAEFLTRENDRLSVETATDPPEGLELLGTGEFDCVVADYDMREMNGIEFLDRVRDRHSDLPFILFTGKGNESIASEAISAGVTDYLRKDPGTNQYAVLANRIENAVEGYRSAIEAERHQHRIEQVREAIALGQLALGGRLELVIAPFDVELVDVVAPLDDADLLRVLPLCFEDELLFSPWSVAPGARLLLQHPDDLSRDLQILHGVSSMVCVS